MRRRTVRIVVTLLIVAGMYFFAIPTALPAFEYHPLSWHRIQGHKVFFEADTSPTENLRRIAELEEVLALLPEELIAPAGPVKYQVSGEPDLCSATWASGCSFRDEPRIGIHERSDADAYPWDWEHFAEDGYTHLERVKVLVHEFGHVVHQHVINIEQMAAFFDVILEAPETVTSYGERSWKEDFADTFAFYVFWPDYLQAHYPLRYAYMYDLFGGVTYEPLDEMPSSVKARLSHIWPLEPINIAPIL